MRTLAWLDALSPHAARLIDAPLADLIRELPDRSRALSMRVGPIHACFARQRVDAAAWSALLDLAEARNVGPAVRDLFDGAEVNRAGPAHGVAFQPGARTDSGRGARGGPAGTARDAPVGR